MIFMAINKYTKHNDFLNIQLLIALPLEILITFMLLRHSVYLLPTRWSRWHCQLKYLLRSIYLNGGK